jgi:hypothetical protein
VSPFLLQVKSVRSALHQLRATLRNKQAAELRVPILSLEKVLDIYSLHLKYLRRHTLTALLSQSRVADQFLQLRKRRKLFLDLENGLTTKELSITLVKCPTLESYLVCKFVHEAGDSLDLILSCLSKLSQAFANVELST